MVHPYTGDARMDLDYYKKDLTLEVMNERGHLVFRYFLHNCWVSAFTSISDLHANANAVTIQTIKLVNEGWECDYGVTDPTKPVYLSMRPLSARTLSG